MITIDTTDKGHFYTEGRATVPSVTTVMPSPECPKNFTGDQWDAILNNAANLGAICHTACAQIAEGKEPDIDAPEHEVEKIGKLITGYWEWFNENVTEVIAVEQPYINTKYGFGGTIDLIARLKGCDDPAIIDIKTSAKIYPTAEIQLAAYGMLTDERHRRVIIRLKKNTPDKPPQFKEYEYKADREREIQAAFLGLLNYYKFINGGKNGTGK